MIHNTPNMLVIELFTYVQSILITFVGAKAMAVPKATREDL